MPYNADVRPTKLPDFLCNNSMKWLNALSPSTVLRYASKALALSNGVRYLLMFFTVQFPSSWFRIAFSRSSHGD